MKNRNWLKLHRKILSSSCFLYDNPAVLKVWIYCLVTANFKESTILRGGTEIVLSPGQFLYSRTGWSKSLGLSEGLARHCIDLLVKWDQLTTKVSHSGLPTIYQIKNWKDYQSEEELTTNVTTNLQPKYNQSTTTSKNDKNDKKLNTIVFSTAQILEFKKQFPNTDVDMELEKAKDYLKAKGKTYKDYSAFFRNWLRSPYQSNGPNQNYCVASDGKVFKTKEELDKALSDGVYSYQTQSSGDLVFYPVI